MNRLLQPGSAISLMADGVPSATAMTRLQTFLAGVKVLDLSQYIPGPFASLLLADMGAEVLKIEPPGGDAMRTLGPRNGAGQPVFYGALNAQKTILRLDLKTDLGRQTLLEYVDTADILIEGFRPGVMQRLGFDYETLHARNLKLIYCSMSGYGTNGPLATAAAHDGNYLATSGIMDRNGSDAPTFFDPPIADMTGALFATVAILGALHGRNTSERGVHIDLGLADALMPLQLLQIAEWASNGTIPKRQSGYLNGGAAYYQVYATADGRHIMLGSIEPKFWRNFCSAAGEHRWVARQNDPLPQTLLIAELAAFFGSMAFDRVMERFHSVDCCLSPVLDLGEALTSTQVKRRGLVRPHNGDFQALFPAMFDGQAARFRVPMADLNSSEPPPVP